MDERFTQLYQGLSVYFSVRKLSEVLGFNPKISYSDFVNEIESSKVVNSSYATTILPQQVNMDFKNIEGLYGQQGTAEYDLVQKAYELGMVDPNTGLLSTNVNLKG